MSALRRHRALLLAVIGGVVFALTSPPTNLYPAVLVGLALLAASLALPSGARKGKPHEPAPLGFWRAFGRGAAWGTAAGVVGLRFVPTVIQRFTDLGTAASLLALVLLAAGQSLIWAIGAGVTALAQRRARVPFELSFALGVFVACSLPTIFAWTPAGLVSPWPAFVQLADVLGERGVSAVLAAVAALLARSALALAGRSPDPESPAPPSPPPLRFSREVLRPALSALAILVILAVHGAIRIRAITRASADLPTVRVGLVDHAIPPRERWDPNNAPLILRRLRDLTHAAEADGAELTVWPEGAYPYPLDHESKSVPRGPMSPLGGKVHGPLLMGLITRDHPTRAPDGVMEINSFNSATVVTADGAMQPPYDKLQLLWFGEMVPLGGELPWLRRLFQRSGGLIPGAEARPLILDRGDEPRLRMAVLNCYEDTLAGVGRRLFNTVSPNLLVNVTNDAWFYDTAEPELHARLGAMRAVELRRDLVRSVNMGVMSWIDAAGVVRARYADSAPSTLLVRPSIHEGGPTWYARVGDAPVQALFALMIVYYALRTRTKAREAKQASEAAADAASGPGSTG